MVVVTNAVVVSATTKSLKDGSVRALKVWALPYFQNYIKFEAMHFISKNTFSWGVILMMVILLSLIIIYTDSFSLPSEKISDGVMAILSAFVGILITVAVTAVLLNTQTEAESSKEKSMKQFEKKQNIYYDFLEELDNIVSTLLERNLKGNDKVAYENVTSLANLLFRFGYLRMHMKDEYFKKVIVHTSNIFKKYREMNISEAYQTEIMQNKHQRSVEINSKLFCLFTELSEELFAISSLLYSDLYQVKNQSLDQHIISEIKRFLNSCGLKNK